MLVKSEYLNFDQRSNLILDDRANFVGSIRMSSWGFHVYPFHSSYWGGGGTSQRHVWVSLRWKFHLNVAGSSRVEGFFRVYSEKGASMFASAVYELTPNVRVYIRVRACYKINFVKATAEFYMVRSLKRFPLGPYVLWMEGIPGFDFVTPVDSAAIKTHPSDRNMYCS